MEWIIKLRLSVADSSVSKVTKLSWYCFGWGHCPTTRLFCGKRFQEIISSTQQRSGAVLKWWSLFKDNQLNGNNQILQLHPRQATSSLSSSPSLTFRFCVTNEPELFAFCLHWQNISNLSSKLHDFVSKYSNIDLPLQKCTQSLTPPSPFFSLPPHPSVLNCYNDPTTPTSALPTMIALRMQLLIVAWAAALGLVGMQGISMARTRRYPPALAHILSQKGSFMNPHVSCLPPMVYVVFEAILLVSPSP